MGRARPARPAEQIRDLHPVTRAMASGGGRAARGKPARRRRLMATKALRESDELPWFKLYVREWLTRLLGASLAAQGALMRLLCVSWDQRSLPIDPDACRRLAGADEREWRRIWPEIREHLEELDGALVSPPLEILRTEAIGDRSSRRLGAKKTNEKRWKTASLSESLSESLSDTLSDTLSGSPSASLNGRYLRVQSSDSDY